MERTITKIKNLKARRKLSLPASPNPMTSASISSNSTSRTESLKYEENVFFNNNSSTNNRERYRRVQWSPDIREPQPQQPSRMRHRHSVAGLKPQNQNGAYRRSESISNVEEVVDCAPAGSLALRQQRGANRRRRQGSLPHVFRNLYVYDHPPSNNNYGKKPFRPISILIYGSLLMTCFAPFRDKNAFWPRANKKISPVYLNDSTAVAKWLSIGKSISCTLFSFLNNVWRSYTWSVFRSRSQMSPACNGADLPTRRR